MDALDRTPPNPSVLCMCGCGGVTPIAKENRPKYGQMKGEHTRYIVHHQTRRTAEWGEHLWDVTDRGYETPCWTWKMAIDAAGYGRFVNRHRIGTSQLAHREAWVREYGDAPIGMHLDHLCRTRCCVRPDHLELVAPRTNIVRGSVTKVGPEVADEMRRVYAESGGRKRGQLRHRDIAAMFNVSESTVWWVLNGKRWHHAP